MSPEEIIWFVFMALMVIIFLLRHLLDDNKDLKKKDGNWVHNYISNWFDKRYNDNDFKKINQKQCIGGTFMCLVREIFDTFGELKTLKINYIMY